MATYTPNQFHTVPLTELQPDPNQTRKYRDPLALEELTAPFSEHGIIQPIVCRQDPQTSLCYVFAGERRCAATRKAGLTTVPAVFITGEKHEKAAIKATGAAATRKRSKTEALVNQLGAIQNKINDLGFPPLSTEDREAVTEALTSLKTSWTRPSHGRPRRVKLWHENFQGVV